MPRINLLPAKRLQREEDLRQEMRILLIVGLGTLVCLVAHERAQASAIDAHRQRLAEVNQAANLYADKIKQIDEFKEASKLLLKKLATIDALQASKTGPSRMLGVFAQCLSDHPRVWLTKFEQNGASVRLSGNAMSQEDISAFQMALSAHPELIARVSLELVNAAKDRNDRVLEWTLVCTLVGFGGGP